MTNAAPEKIEDRMKDRGDGRHIGWWSENLLDYSHLLVEVCPGTLLIACCEGEHGARRINFITSREKAIEITRALMKALEIEA